MKRYFFLATLFIICQSLSAQSEDQQIREALFHYIEGTSYNQPDRIEKAFYAEADLFLDNKEKKLWVVPSAEYISWFKKGTPGEFNGRIGKLLSIDYFGNIAMAKVEILLAGRSLQFIDMFILKKIEGTWKIISKTANSKKTNKSGKRILFVTSNVDYYGDSDIHTGNSFSEITDAYHTFDQAGYTIDFVSPQGGAIPLAYINTSDSLQKKYLYQSDFMYTVGHTYRPEELKASDYAAGYYVGGGSAMYGVPENEAIQQLAMQVYEEHNGIISSICHGTAGIINLKTKDGKYLVAGKKVNGYPDDFERHDAAYYQQFPFRIQHTIEERGGTFRYSPRNTPHLEVEGRLITGQNHYSTKLLALKIIETLEQEPSK